MPVDVNLPKEGMIFQREQYQKGGVGRLYWDYRDSEILKYIEDEKIIVDIGCGEGILMEKIIQRLPDVKVFGIDLSFENVSICKEHGLKVCSGSVYGLPLDDSSLECVLFIEVIEHLDEPESAIKEINRVLKKDGFLILLFPHDSFFKLARILTFKFREAFYNAGHVRQWTPKEMVGLLESSGFRIVSKKNIPFYIWSISLHCLIVAKRL